MFSGALEALNRIDFQHKFLWDPFLVEYHEENKIQSKILGNDDGLLLVDCEHLGARLNLLGTQSPSVEHLGVLNRLFSCH